MWQQQTASPWLARKWCDLISHASDSNLWQYVFIISPNKLNAPYKPAPWSNEEERRFLCHIPSSRYTISSMSSGVVLCLCHISVTSLEFWAALLQWPHPRWSGVMEDEHNRVEPSRVATSGKELYLLPLICVVDVSEAKSCSSLFNLQSGHSLTSNPLSLTNAGCSVPCSELGRRRKKCIEVLDQYVQDNVHIRW